MHPNDLTSPTPGSIGALLVTSGRLTTTQANVVLEHQRRTGERFGDAAVRLGLVKPEAIRAALSAQFRYPYLAPGNHTVAPEVIAAYEPFTPAVERFRGLRARLMLRLLEMDRPTKAIAVVSPGEGEGRSYLVANLGVVFAQLGERTLIVDADLREPRQHALFGLENRQGLSHLLSGRVVTDDTVKHVPGLNLDVLPAGAVPPNPQELLLGPRLLPLIAELSHGYDIVLFDTSAAGTEDAVSLAARLGVALLVARRNATSLPATKALVKRLTESGCVIAGAAFSGKA